MSDVQDAVAETPKWQRKGAWLRGFFMLAFAIFFALGQTLLNLIALVQFFWLLFAAERNETLSRFGTTLGLWLAEVARFQSCASDEKPFPWKDWPSAR